MIPALIVFLGALAIARSQQSDVEVAQCATSSLEGFDFQVGVGTTVRVRGGTLVRQDRGTHLDVRS